MERAMRMELVGSQAVRERVATIRAKLLKTTVKVVVGTGVALGVLVWLSFNVVKAWGYVTTQAEKTYQAAVNRVTRVEVRRELVRADAIPLSQLTQMAAKKHRVPSVVLQAVIEQESRGGELLYRFEPASYAKLKTRAKDSDSEIRMLASSHGVAHVMGFNAQPRCGVHWSKLYDPSIGMECGAKILRENMEEHANVKDSSRRIWLALRDYNGAGPDAEQYATRVMARIGALLLADLREQM